MNSKLRAIMSIEVKMRKWKHTSEVAKPTIAAPERFPDWSFKRLISLINPIKFSKMHGNKKEKGCQTR